MYKMLSPGVSWSKGVECKYLKILLKNKSATEGKCVINCVSCPDIKKAWKTDILKNNAIWRTAV